MVGNKMGNVMLAQKIYYALIMLGYSQLQFHSKKFNIYFYMFRWVSANIKFRNPLMEMNIYSIEMYIYMPVCFTYSISSFVTDLSVLNKYWIARILPLVLFMIIHGKSVSRECLYCGLYIFSIISLSSRAINTVPAI